MKGTLKRNEPQKAKQYFDNKITFSIGPAELKNIMDNNLDAIIIDVREAKDFAEGHIPSAINLPHAEWKTLRGLDKEKQHIVYCYSAVCHLAATAAAFFASKDFSVMEMDGGIEQWKAYNYPLETAAAEKMRA